MNDEFPPYPVGGTDDAKQLWITKFQRAAQRIAGFPAGENDRLELEYSRLTYDAANKQYQEAITENQLLHEQLAARPQQIANLVTEKIMVDVEKFVAAIVTKFSAGIVNKGILPRLDDVKEAAATLPAIEARQRELEGRLRLLVALLDMGAEMARVESMHEEVH